MQSGERVTKRRTCGILYFTRQSEGDYTSSTPAKISVVQNDRLLFEQAVILRIIVIKISL